MATGKMVLDRKTAIKMIIVILAIFTIFFISRISYLFAAPIEPTGATSSGNGDVSIGIQHPYCEIDIFMYKTWNLISIKCEQSDNSLTTVLSSISGNYTVVEAYYANDSGDPWKKYDVSVPPFINDLNTMDNKHGYWINMTSNDTLEINGTLPHVTNIDMLITWNLVGYPSNSTKTVTNALSSISGNYTVVEAYYANDSGDPWKKYDVSVPPFINDLDDIVPGYGHWINMTANDTWEVQA